jgi:hypothetical protein
MRPRTEGGLLAFGQSVAAAFDRTPQMHKQAMILSGSLSLPVDHGPGPLH